MAHTGENVLKGLPLKAIALAIALSNPVSAQTLEQAVSITLASNPELKSAFNQFKSREYDAEASSGAYLPKIDLDAGIGYEAINPAESSGNRNTDLTRKDATLTLTQLIWDGSATLNDMDRTAAEAEADRYQLLADASNMALEVAKIYLDATKASEILTLSENNLAIHKDIYRDIKKRADSGIGSTADVTQVEARLAKAHSNLVAAQNNLFDIYTQFRRLVGQEPVSLEFPRADQNAIPPTLENALNMAQENHPVIKVAQADVDAARFQYKQSKAPNHPAGVMMQAVLRAAVMSSVRCSVCVTISTMAAVTVIVQKVRLINSIVPRICVKKPSVPLRKGFAYLGVPWISLCNRNSFWQITLILHPKRLFRIVNSIKSASVHCSISSTLRMSFSRHARTTSMHDMLNNMQNIVS